jgi:hypothetical protein
MPRDIIMKSRKFVHTSMQRKHIAIVGALVAVFSIAAVCFCRSQIALVLNYGELNLPSHSADANCTWTKRTFSRKGISFFEQNCPTPAHASYWIFYEDLDGRVMRMTNDPHDDRRLLTMELFTDRGGRAPTDIMNELYAKLSSEQQKKCEIQNADEPLQYSSNGTQLDFEGPHPTPHKTRYKIGIKPEIVQGIADKYDGLPNGQQYDYLCGQAVGSPFVASEPYFEFDDRSPDRYLFVGSLGNDGSVLIDLNSIHF